MEADDEVLDVVDVELLVVLLLDGLIDEQVVDKVDVEELPVDEVLVLAQVVDGLDVEVPVEVDDDVVFEL